MSDMLEGRMVLDARHVVLGLRRASLISLVSTVIVLVIIVPATFVRKVLRSLMFMRTAIVLKPPDDLVDIVGRVLVELLVVAEDDDGDVDLAEDGEFMRLLEEAAFTLEEGDGSARDVSGDVASSRGGNQTYRLRSSRMGLICPGQLARHIQGPSCGKAYLNLSSSHLWQSLNAHQLSPRLEVWIQIDRRNGPVSWKRRVLTKTRARSR